MSNKDENMEMTNEQKLIRGLIFEDDEEPKKEEIKEKEENKEDKPLIMGLDFSEDKNDPENFTFCILYKYGDENGDEISDWKEIEGRKNLYEFIKENVETMDLDNSFVLSEKMNYNEKLTVYEFVKYMIEERGLYQDEDDNFMIDEYR